jgi:hypothetical protein
LHPHQIPDAPVRPALPERARRARGPVLRAGAGAALLLGVTAAVTALPDAGAPAPADAAAVLTDGPAAPAPDPLAAAARAQERALQAREEAARESARSARREAAARAAAAQRAAAARAAAAKAAAAKKALAARRAAAAAVASGDPRTIARGLLAARGWSGQFGCLDALWQRESGWDPQAANPSSGAFGIPQALPGGKMASAGADWRTNPATQIRWGLAYIASTYGTPCGAWAHSEATGWY